MISASDLSGFNILHEPEFDVGSTGSENGQTRSCFVSTHRQVKLGVVGVLLVDAM